MQTQTHNKILIILLVIFLLGDILFATMFVKARMDLSNANQTIAGEKTNAQVLVFARLFFNKVLQGNKEVSFDDRLQLENAVRALNDKDIFDSWNKFTLAKSQTEVQADFYSLFELLLGKIQL